MFVAKQLITHKQERECLPKLVKPAQDRVYLAEPNTVQKLSN